MTTPCNAVILGAGGHAQVAWSIWKTAKAADANFPVTVVGWLETVNYVGPSRLLDLPVFQETVEGWTALHALDVKHCYLGLGMVKAAPQRWNVVQKLIQQGLSPLTLVHPSAIVSPDAELEAGCLIAPRAVVQPFARIGEGVIINTGAIVEHHAQIGRNTHIAPGATLCGHVSVGAHGMIGAGAVVIQHKKIGDEVTVGAGSVVIRDIPDRAVAVGNPAAIVEKATLSTC